MTRNDEEMERDHNLQAALAMLAQILDAARTGGLPNESSDKIERKLRDHLDLATDEALRWIANGIDFDEWNRRLSGPEWRYPC